MNQPTPRLSLLLWDTLDGVGDTHIWYMDTTHMNAKLKPINAPAHITTQANG